MSNVRIIDYHISSFFERIENILQNRVIKNDSSDLPMLYIQNSFLLKREFYSDIPGISWLDLLLFELKEALYTRNYDRMSGILEQLEKEKELNRTIQVFVFCIQMLLIAYRGESELVERSVDEYVGKYQKQFHERMRLYIYCFILSFYPNLPFKTMESINPGGEMDRDLKNRIIKSSILAEINNSMKRYDKSYLYLSKALKECIEGNDLINYFQIYEQKFFYECIRGDISRVFQPLDQIIGLEGDNPAFSAIYDFYRLLFNYIINFNFERDKASEILSRLGECRLYTYVHRLCVLMLANRCRAGEIYERYPTGRVFCDIEYLEKSFSDDLQPLPFYICGEFMPILYFQRICNGLLSSLPPKVHMGGNLNAEAVSVDHYSVYQAYRDLYDMLDAKNRHNYEKILLPLENMSQHAGKSRILEKLLDDISHYLLVSSLATNKTLLSIIRDLDDNEKKLIYKRLSRDLTEGEAFSLIGSCRAEEEDPGGVGASLPEDYEGNDLEECEELKALIGKSRHIAEIKKKIIKFSAFSFPVLITGESGTGKELVARAIHTLSRREGMFISINCSAIPESLFESELFGYRKGAFSGASFDKKGLIESADRGTLFLDEIGDLPYTLQAKLLRFLQEGEILSLGGNRNKQLDVRVIAATNIDIEEEIRKRNFRNDLYQRLNVLSIFIRPLRERKGDIKHLIHHFVGKYRDEFQIAGIDNINEIEDVFENYDWRGNIRELENEIIRIFAQLGSEKHIKKEYISRKILEKSGNPQKTTAKEPPDDYKKPAERDIIKTWQAFGGNYAKTARELSISRQWVHKVIKKYKAQ